MLNYNDILRGTFIELDGEIFEVLENNIFRKQQRKPVNQTKLKNVATGRVTERAFHQSEKVEEADLEKISVAFLYRRGSEVWFCKAGAPSERFALAPEQVESSLPFLTEGMELTALLAERDAPLAKRILTVTPPIKVELAVAEAPPSIKGNTAQGGTKRAVLASGAEVDVPLFIESGDRVIVNTQTGEYVERAK